MVTLKWNRLIFIGLLLAGWQLLFISGRYSPALVPSLQSIGGTFTDECLNGQLPKAVVYSIVAIFKGLLWSVAVSGILVLIGSATEWLDDLVEFVVSIAHPLPGIAILPLVILWFGIGEKAVLFVVIHSMLWPMVVTIKAEVKRLKNRYQRVSKAFNLSRFKTVVHIYLVGTVPGIITGAKIAWSRGWRAFISAEMVFGIVGQKSGLGWYLFEQRVYMNAAGLFSGLIAIILCGVFIEQVIFNRLDTWVQLRWR